VCQRAPGLAAPAPDWNNDSHAVTGLLPVTRTGSYAAASLSA
jgi:hypothetical protein